MADAAKVVGAVDKTYADIQTVKTRMTGVTGQLNQLKVAVATALPSDAGKGSSLNVTFVREQLMKAKEDLAKFREAVREAAERGEAGGVGGGPGMRKQMKDDKTRTMYERVGGDLNVETCVEIMYNKALQDSRLRSFFEKNQRKMQNIRKRMFQFLSGYLGGPKLYDMANLKPAHYHMNITDYHFDAMLELFAQSMTELGVHADANKDVVSATGKIRKDLTTGCTVRMELAKKNMEKGKDGLFKRLGGQEGITQFIDRLYDLVAVDNRLKAKFGGKDLKKMKEGQYVYMTELLGGPKVYKGADLVAIHKGVGLTDYEFDCFLANMEKALTGLGMEDETVDEVIVTSEDIRAPLLNRARGLAAHAKLVDGKSVLDRFGGEMNVEAVVEMMYGGFRGDPRVRFFYEFTKEKLEQWKLKMTQVMVGAFGGAITYEDSKLRTAHYKLNITDYHFDAFLENFWVAAELMETESAVIQDAVDVLGHVRKDVTSGCTVRLEVARKRVESAGTDGLYEACGGEEGLRLFMDKLYEHICVDSRIQHYFSGSKLDAVKSIQGQYLSVIFGAPIQYTGRPLDRVHSVMSISDYEFDCFLESAQTALREVGADGSSIDEAIVIMETARRDVLINRKPHDVRKTQEAASAKSVYERIGGEGGIANFVEQMYEKATADVRTKSFFEKNKAKVSVHKKQLVSFLAKLFGGPSSYELSDVRAAHYTLNLSDYHFDCLLDIFSSVFKEMGVKPRDQQDAIQLLQPIRSDVTTGYTVRMEMARKNVEKGKDQLFKRLGASEGITQLVEMWFNIAKSDARLKDAIGDSIDKMKAGATIFLVELLGGPKAYKGRSLGEIHRSIDINDYHFDALIGDLSRALLGAGHPDNLIDEVMVTVEPVRAEVLEKVRAAMDSVLMRDGKSLLERFGGDMDLETAVEGMYDKAVEDSRVRFHFEKAKAKQRQVRRKMYQYICGQFGGPQQYDNSQLRPTHYNMNITDYHFDVILNVFMNVSKEMGVSGETLMDVQVILNRSRADITTGCTVRMELSKKKNAQDGMDQLFQRLGGLDGVMAMVDRLYECVGVDKRVSNFFEGAKTHAIKRSVTDFLIMTLGGPAEYRGRSIEDSHAVIQITDYHFDCYMQNAGRAMRDVGAEQDAVDEVTVVLEPMRKQVLAHHYKENK